MTVNRKGVAVIAAIWIFCGIVNAGLLNAHLRKGFPELCNSREASSQRAFSLGWGLFSGPLGLIYALFFTSFHKDGWTLSAVPHCGDRG